MTEWNLRGMYAEACNCEAACPCVFLSDPTEGECTALVGWHVEEGRFGDTGLDGLNTAVAVFAPGNMAQEPWTVALYVDERADDAQREALTSIFAGQAGGHPARIAEHIGEVLGVASAPIEYKADDGRRALRVGDVADFEIDAIQGQGGQRVMVRHHPLAIAPGHEAVVARSTRLRYADHGLSWEISDRTGFFSPFTYEGG